MAERGEPRRRRRRDLMDLLTRAGGSKTKDGTPLDEALSRRLWELAASGDLAAARLLLAYLLGKPAQRAGEEEVDQSARLTDEDIRSVLDQLAAWKEKHAAGIEAQGSSAWAGPEQTRQ